ncbi:MAG: hypothetical protein SF187_22370 [Deltaproteobacteria bacterium]|nr:hypothetical protein [Deltaproteobacteria bacterium]
MKSTATKSSRCAECGVGTVEPKQAAGRETPYKTLILPIPSSVGIPTCDNCGTEWIDDSTAASLDAALEKEYRARLKALLKTTLDKSVVSKAAIERALGLSQGYLSHLTGSGDKVPSEALAYSVISIAQAGTSDVEALWTRLSGVRPPALGKAQVAKKNSAARSSGRTAGLRARRSSTKATATKRAS